MEFFESYGIPIEKLIDVHKDLSLYKKLKYLPLKTTRLENVLSELNTSCVVQEVFEIMTDASRCNYLKFN